MLRYLVRRIGELLIVVLGVSSVVFVALRASGDPALLLAPQGATPHDLAVLRGALGLADPIPLQYLHFLSRVVVGDFGTSYEYREPAILVVLNALPVTMVLTIAALSFAVAVSVPIGIISAIKRDSWLDVGAMTVALLGQAMPVFWLGLLLILLFAVQLRWLPTGGWGSVRELVLPAVSLGAYSMARTSRLVRSGMLEVLSQDYIRTAHSKGLGDSRVVIVHALRNALIPVLTVIGLEFGVLLGGAVITETIFSVPGVGRLAVTGVLNRDYPIVQASVFCAALLITTVNLLVDLAYTRLDPRIRLR